MAAAADEQWTFNVDKAKPTGSNPYLRLEPGLVRTCKGGGTDLKISVLNHAVDR